jgi:DNA-binding NtrC family response regulator
MPHKILIVDDDQATRDGLAALLAAAGYDTVTASGVPTAMEILSDQRPDLLIVDIRLDAYNGLQLVALGPKPIPAIVMTGFADPALEADARQLGADFLLKPVSPPTLRALIAHKLATSGGMSESTRRWPRKGVTTEMAVRVEPASARVLDIGYGGVRLEVQRIAGTALPLAFRVTFPTAAVSVPVDVVWTRRRDDTTWLCGAVVAEDAQSQWRAVVDDLG